MKFFKYLVFSFLICSVCANLQAQEQTGSINDGSISDQFEFAIEKSNNYTDGKGRAYEVIRRSMLLSLKANAIDSLNTVRTKLDNTANTVKTQDEEINTLKANLAQIQDELSSTIKEKDSMSFFGKQMGKTSYNILMWSIIAALSAFLLTFVYKFKNSNVVTKAAKNKLADLQNEFKEHKRNALEREQKVKRQLQDEINKREG